MIKKCNTILKCLIWPVLFGIGQICVQFYLFSTFQKQIILNFQTQNPSLKDSTIIEMAHTFLQSSKGQAQFLDYCIDRFWIILLFNVCIMLPIFLYRYQKCHNKELKLKTMNAIQIGIVSITIGLALNIVLSFLFPSSRFNPQPIIWVTLLSTGIIGPLIEELIFRGIIYKNLLDTFSKKNSIIILLIGFAIIHTNITQFIYAFIMGGLFLFYLEKYKTIKAPILSHILSNLAIGIGISIIMGFSIPYKVTLCVLFLIIGLFVLQKQYKKE